MFEKVSTDLNFVSREVEIEKFWRENDIFQKSVDQREGSDVFMFYDGPPTANGKPHIGHIETRAIKDLIPRYQHHEGQQGAPQGRMGYPRTAGGAGSGKDPGPGRQGADRGLRHRALHSEVQGIRLEIQGRMGRDERTCGLLGRHGASLHHL